MSRALVTGAAGFIGSHVVDYCKKLGMHVTATDDLSGGFLSNILADRGSIITADAFVPGDIRDAAFVKSLWSGERYDYVYHLAAYAAEGLSHFIRRYNYMTNLVGSANLINEAVNHDVKCFVFTSSIAVYGRGQLPMTEEQVPEPEDPYGISKYAVELDLKAAHEMFGMDFVIMRPHNVYGPRQNIADRYRNVIGIFMSQALRGQPLSIFGDGLQTRAFSYIDDVAPLIAESVFVKRARNQVFNVGSDVSHTVLDVACEVGEALGVPVELRRFPERNEVVHAYASHAKLRAFFESASDPSVDLKTGIRKMAEWVKTRGPTPPVTFSEIEVRKNLPEAWR